MRKDFVGTYNTKSSVTLFVFHFIFYQSLIVIYSFTFLIEQLKFNMKKKKKKHMIYCVGGI